MSSDGKDRKAEGGLVAVPVFLAAFTVVLVVWYMIQDGRGGATASTGSSAAATGRS